MKKFLITESDINQIKSLYVSKGILSKNEFINKKRELLKKLK